LGLSVLLWVVALAVAVRTRGASAPPSESSPAADGPTPPDTEVVS